MELDSFLLILCFLALLVLFITLYNYKNKFYLVDNSDLRYGLVVDLKETKILSSSGSILTLVKIVVLVAVNKTKEYYYSFDGSEKNFNYPVGSYVRVKLNGNKIEILGLVKSSEVKNKFKNYLEQNYSYLCES